MEATKNSTGKKKHKRLVKHATLQQKEVNKVQPKEEKKTKNGDTLKLCPAEMNGELSEIVNDILLFVEICLHFL